MKWFAYGWGVLILTLSSIPNFNPPGSKIEGIDKLAHFVEYLIFGWVVFSSSRERHHKYLLPLILAFAIIDEFHQKYIPGREMEGADLGLNFVGILCGLLLNSAHKLCAGKEDNMWLIKRKENNLSPIYAKLDQLNERIKKLECNFKSLRTQRIKPEDSRIGVFVDVQNMFYAAKKQYDARLDYVKLLRHVVKKRRLITAIAYVIENPEIDQTSFFSLLSHHSFRIRKKSLIQRADGSQKGDCDMEIALDILNFVDQLDVVALVSGDGDFVSLVEAIKTKGPKVEVHGFAQNTAIDLKEVADEFFPIGEELLFRQ